MAGLFLCGLMPSTLFAMLEKDGDETSIGTKDVLRLYTFHPMKPAPALAVVYSTKRLMARMKREPVAGGMVVMFERREGGWSRCVMMCVVSREERGEVGQRSVSTWTVFGFPRPRVQDALNQSLEERPLDRGKNQNALGSLTSNACSLGKNFAYS